MLYSLLILTFGIYLGQEYPSIPLVKNIVKKTLAYYNQSQNIEKIKEKRDGEEIKEKRDGEEITNLGYSEVLLNSLKDILKRNTT